MEPLPIVLIINNDLGGLSLLFSELGGKADIRIGNQNDYLEVTALALKDGPPVVVGIGCVSHGADYAASEWTHFLKLLRRPEPAGPGYTGPVLGLCTFCSRQHKEAGCDEVFSVEDSPTAGQRILEILEEQSRK